MPAKATKAAVPQVPAGPPVRLEVRLDGKVRFANNCYDVQLSQDEDTVTLGAALKPRMVDAAPPTPARPPQRFGDDPRDGEEIIQRIHSGRLDR